MMYLLVDRGAVIRRKLRKVEPFQPVGFAQRAQEMFIEVNNAIRRQEKTLSTLLLAFVLRVPCW